MEIGVLLAGKYRVERVLGRGGQGEVVLATNLQLGGPVAMKFLLPEMARDPALVQRFLREARAAAKLKSEHVARVIDLGTLDNGAPFIVFEYLEGADLKTHQRDGIATPIIDLMIQATEALAEAHAKGIVHRDLKPANLFVTRANDDSPLLKILDFGISKTIDTALPTLTSSLVMMGTPSYMSPEQLMSSKDVDHRTDIWSLGVVLYEFLEGRVPYDADTLTQLAIKVMTQPVPPMMSNAPPALVEVVGRCLEKDPARRYQTMGELAHALATFAHSSAHAAIAVPPPPSPKRRTWRVAAAIGALAGVMFAIGFAVLRGSDHAAPEPAPAGEVRQMASVPPPPPLPPPAPPAVVDDRPAQAERRVADALTAFADWTKTHPADPCPSIDALASPKADPWGSPLVVTCTDQPGDQIAGVISPGPDRTLGTDDDIRSWTLAPDRIAVAKGPRWNPKPPPPVATVRPKVPHKAAGKRGSADKPPPDKPAIVDRDGDGIPDVR